MQSSGAHKLGTSKDCFNSIWVLAQKLSHDMRITFEDCLEPPPLSMFVFRSFRLHELLVLRLLGPEEILIHSAHDILV